MNRPTYTVTLSFQYPAWDETRGIPYYEVEASSKSEAIRSVRRQATHDGHIPCSGKGRYFFRAEADQDLRGPV